jgi:hypothetical protein
MRQPSALYQVARALRDARQRLQDPTLAVAVTDGEYIVNRVTYADSGVSLVSPVSPAYLTLPELVAFLATMEA